MYSYFELKSLTPQGLDADTNNVWHSMEELRLADLLDVAAEWYDKPEFAAYMEDVEHLIYDKRLHMFRRYIDKLPHFNRQQIKELFQSVDSSGIEDIIRNVFEWR